MLNTGRSHAKVPTHTSFQLNQQTSVKISSATDKREYFYVCLSGGRNTVKVFIKLQAASVDNDKKGIWIGRELDEDGSFVQPYWQMPESIHYPGEICAIAESGSPTIYVTEY